MAKTATDQAQVKHPFAELLAQYRARKPGLTQTRLAELAGYDQAIVVRMAQGKKDLTGPSGRERVVRLIETLAEQGALTTLDEANGLLIAAAMPPLFEKHPIEARLITRLARTSTSHRVRRTNLPASLSAFIGRAQETADVRRLLTEARLVTLTGAGGCGKTRLAQRVAADVLLNYADGVWYVELASLADASLIADAVSRVFGLVASDRPHLEQLADFLRERHALLVLDNCEHIIDGAAEFAVRMLSECARLSILTTSREALNVDGELAWRVPPMLPDEAAQLFIERARLARPSQSLSAADAMVEQICERLDGMPLAIELAAARLQSLSLNDIATRLDDRFALLVGGRRGVLPRHQTLRALIDWSYDALSKEEKIAFRVLGVFVGGWELEQAQIVVGADVFALLMQLVSKSLVVMEEHDGVTRYRYLETMRVYALEKLAEAREADEMRRRHAEAYLHLTEESVAWLHGAHQRTWLARLEREYSNAQAALAWCLELQRDALMGCRIAGALFHFWYIASRHHQDARKWTSIAKNAIASDMPPSVQAWILFDEEWFLGDASTKEERCRRIYDLFVQAGDHAGAVIGKWVMARAVFYIRRDYLMALRLHEECVNEAQTVGAAWELRFSLEGLGECLRFAQHDPVRAEATYREAMTLAKSAGDMDEYARNLGYYISGFAMERLQFEESLRCAEEALTLARQTDDLATVLSMQCVVAENLYYLGRTQEAVAMLESCRALALEYIDTYAMISVKVIQARIALTQQDYAQAHALLTESLNMRRASLRPGQFLWNGHHIVDAMSALAGAQGRAIRAARLRGVADAMFAQNHHYRKANITWEYAPYIAKARAALGDEAYEGAYAEGRAMTLEQAIAYALSQSDKGDT